MGFLGDRVSRRWLFRVGVAMNGLGLAAQSLLIGRAGLLASTVVAGISFPLWHIAYIPLLTGCSREEERVHLFSVVAAAWLVTGVLGSALAGVLPGLCCADGGAAGGDTGLPLRAAGRRRLLRPGAPANAVPPQREGTAVR